MGPAVERINFQNPNAGKPTNLQNSAVLRMLEEEEQRGGRSGDVGYYPNPSTLKDVNWPPPEYDQKTQLRSSFKDVVTPGSKRVTWPPPQEGLLESSTEVVQEISVHQTHQQQRGGPQNSNRSPAQSSNNYSVQQHKASSSFNQQQQQQQQQQFNRPLKPLDVSSVGSGSPSLQSPAQNQIPYGFQRSATPAGATINKGWAPVQSPVSPLGSGAQKYFGAPAIVAQSYPNQPSPVVGTQQFNSAGYSSQQSLKQQSYQSAPSAQPNNQQFQSQSVVQNQFQAPTSSSSSSVAQSQTTPSSSAPRSQSGKQPFEPPPSLITLRATAPVSQARAPVYSAQPATSSLKGGKHLRGDLKWPPEDVRQRMAEEQQHLIDLSKGPAIRPMKKDKDYTPFFEQHALNHAYPGYKIPPGTQYFRPDF